MHIEKDLVWTHYIAETDTIDKEKCGKWMSFFGGDLDKIFFVEDVCKEAVERGIVEQAKHTSSTHYIVKGEGVMCFYVNGDDNDGHRRIISYFLEKGLIPKTKAGKFYNISFKYDKQTLDNEYGSDFSSDIKLNQFIDLYTGKWLKH
ncbi:hypothetical protein [Pumilibacter intestinalis]|uniref:hypothetical protein n=1 Tax=Pumilibacter intestinalis TaxID=2941511 RepID=UPI00203A7BF2|nr:hypothetical protein [Pumilibacter intestinalis]